MHELLSQMNNLFQSLGVQGLALNSFIESFFLVPPPDILLVAMDLAKPERALYYATICTIFSALGGVVGYLIGFWGGRPVGRKISLPLPDPAAKFFCYWIFRICFSQAHAARSVSSSGRSARQPNSSLARCVSAQTAGTSPARRPAIR